LVLVGQTRGAEHREGDEDAGASRVSEAAGHGPFPARQHPEQTWGSAGRP
jgi:hypothetical protein